MDKNTKKHLFNFGVFILAWIFTTLFVWWMTYDTFGWGFEESSAAVLSGYSVLLFFDFMQDIYGNKSGKGNVYNITVSPSTQTGQQISDDLEKYRKNWGR